MHIYIQKEMKMKLQALVFLRNNRSMFIKIANDLYINYIIDLFTSNAFHLLDTQILSSHFRRISQEPRGGSRSPEPSA